MSYDRKEHVVLIEKYLRKTDYITRKEGRTILNDFNITVPQFTALQILLNSGDMTIGDLSLRMDLACSTITDLVDRMEKSKFVQRVKDKNDKRVVRINVLDNGKDVLNKVMERRLSFLSSKLISLTEEEMKHLESALEKLYKNMEKNDE